MNNETNNMALANQANIIKGEKYRFTILTDRLIRMEYSEDGIFEDRITSLVLNRNMPVVKYEMEDRDNLLLIRTKYFVLTYQKNKPFKGNNINQMSNLRVELRNSNRIWYYGHPEARNYGAPNFSIDDNNGKLTLSKGLYSLDGFVSIDDSNSDILLSDGNFTKRNNKSIDIYLFMYLKDFGYCLQDYYALTGYPPLIPRYAFGNWWSKNEEYTEASLKELIEQFEVNEIPLSVILLDKDWHLRDYDGKKITSGFTWDYKKYENPSELISYLHKKNIFLGLHVNPIEGIYPIENNFEQLNRLMEKNDKGIIPFNTFDNNLINNYINYLISPLTNMNVDFFWLDIDSKSNVKDLLYLNQAHLKEANRNNKRYFGLSRNTMVAPHRYPVMYSGKTIANWDTLKVIPMYNASCINMGINLFSHDVGGYFKGTEDNELYTRFVQLGVFSPIVKFGADKGKYYKREPWKWNMKTYSIVKKYLKLRNRLIPYIYTESYKNHRYGMPLITPIFYKNPALYDDNLYRNSYYFGTELFISPIVSKKDYVMDRSIHRLYLPDGVWYDFFTGKKFIGNKKYISFYSEKDYPVFAKAGAIIPLTSKEELNNVNNPKNMEIQVFPGRSNSYKLYEDDGITNNYKKGDYIITDIEYNYLPNNYNIIIRPIEGRSGIIDDTRNYKVVFRNTKAPSDVLVYLNDKKIEAKTYALEKDFIVEVEDVSTVSQLSIICRGKNIEIEAIRIINDEIEGIISDLQIETRFKELIDKIFFSDLTIKKKKIEIRKLKGKGLDGKFIELFLKLLDYVNINN